MALTHLADTSVLTRLAVPTVRHMLRELLTRRRIGRCTMSDLELGFSARNAGEWDQIRSAVALFPKLDIQAEDLVQAGTVQRALADRGLRGRKLPDLIIAAVAARDKLIVVHYDQDFELIAEVTGQRQEWVVPRASIN
ncbi:MAG: PIN domain nuclease [Acidimicrobiales bacterium]|nr:MAG: PIN domain nuclease [Acidimicrobiales bacterium]